MPAEMQEAFRTMSEARGLWQGAKVATHQDLSALFVTRAVQLYLRSAGRFAFVMPSAVLDRRQYEGFRSGSYDSEQHQLRAQLGPPWDLRKIRPHFFPITASVIFGRRSDTPSPLPRAGEVWAGKVPKANTSWSYVEKLITRESVKAAREVAEVSSPYHSRFRQGATIVPRVLFMVERQAPGPLGQVKGRINVRSTRSSNEKRPWKDLAALEGVVESEFVYRVHLGETVLPYRTLEPLLAVLPTNRKGMLDEENELPFYRGLGSWWGQATAHWQANRSSERLSLRERLDFHRGLSTQLPVPEQRIVYTKSGMHLAAARVTDHRAIIDHKLYWASVSSTEEGRYLCAILNAAVVTQKGRPLMSYGKDERDIDKYVWSLPIPMFDPKNAAHVGLAELGKKAEDEVAALPLEGPKNFVTYRRAVRAHLEQSEVGRAIEAAVGALLGG
jgi:hypothetical protein